MAPDGLSSSSLFDEAHILTDNPPDQPSWNLFSELELL